MATSQPESTHTLAPYPPLKPQETPHPLISGAWLLPSAPHSRQFSGIQPYPSLAVQRRTATAHHQLWPCSCGDLRLASRVPCGLPRQLPTPEEAAPHPPPRPQCTKALGHFWKTPPCSRLSSHQTLLFLIPRQPATTSSPLFSELACFLAHGWVLGPPGNTRPAGRGFVK